MLPVRCGRIRLKNDMAGFISCLPMRMQSWKSVGDLEYLLTLRVGAWRQQEVVRASQGVCHLDSLSSASHLPLDLDRGGIWRSQAYFGHRQ